MEEIAQTIGTILLAGISTYSIFQHSDYGHQAKILIMVFTIFATGMSIIAIYLSDNEQDRLENRVKSTADSLKVANATLKDAQQALDSMQGDLDSMTVTVIGIVEQLENAEKEILSDNYSTRKNLKENIGESITRLNALREKTQGLQEDLSQQSNKIDDAQRRTQEELNLVMQNLTANFEKQVQKIQTYDSLLHHQDSMDRIRQITTLNTLLRSRKDTITLRETFYQRDTATYELLQQLLKAQQRFKVRLDSIR